MHINAFDEVFTALTNPKHQKEVRDVFVTVCNGAVETLVKTAHQVLTNSDSGLPNSTTSPLVPVLAFMDEEEEYESKEEEELCGESKAKESPDEAEESGWIGKVSSALAVPSNRRLVLDVTGRVTFETVRSCLEFLMEKLYEGVKRCFDFVRESGFGVVRYVGAKFSVFVSIWLSLCLHILDGAGVLVPS